MTDPASGGRPRLLLLDGHSLAYRAFYALPVENFATVTGQATNAVFGFTSMLINTVRDEAPTHLAVAFDVSRRSFRTDLYPEYKATRSASPDGFSGQVELVREVLEALRIPVFAVEGYEADDVIGTLATRASDAGFEVRVLTGDRDAFQLISDNVTVLYPRKGVSDLARIDTAEVEARYGVPPGLYRDLAALVGESSDNLPGVAGVGPKTAAKWLLQYGTLPDLLAHADALPGKAGDSLRAARDTVALNHQVNALVLDLPLGVELDQLVRQSVDVERANEVFAALEFKVLRDRLFSAWGEDAVEEASSPGASIAIVAAAEGGLRDRLTAIARTGRVGLATSGSWARGEGDARTIALASSDGTVLVVSLALSSVDREALAEFLADPQVPKALHDAKPQLLALGSVDLDVRGITCDTALAAYVVSPGRRSFDLAGLVRERLRQDLDAAPAAAGADQLSFDLDAAAEEDTRSESLARTARAVLDLADVLDREVVSRGGAALLRDVELPLVSVLAGMERAGIALDMAYLRDLEQTYAAAVRDAEAAAHDDVGQPFNLGSPKQLQQILFVDRNLPKTKKIKTGYTTDADALAWLATVTDDSLVEHLLRWRDVSRLRQTVGGLLPLADKVGRVHTTFNQTVAATGRLSSTDPNLQNIPIRTEEGRRIRSGFVVGEGYESLMTADYSQIEMRIMAHLSKDEGLIAAFNAGEDLHTTVASQVFGVAAGDVDAEQRRRIKAMSYGLAYGLSSFGLSAQLGISNDESKVLMDGYFQRFGGVRDYLSSVVAQARELGYTETVMGRRRYLPDLTSDNRVARQNAERMALNAPIQGSAADIVKVAMLRVHAALASAGLGSRLLLQVHDELVLEIAPGERDVVEALVRTEMANAFDLSVALDVSVGVGRTWQDAGH